MSTEKKLEDFLEELIEEELGGSEESSYHQELEILQEAILKVIIPGSFAFVKGQECDPLVPGDKVEEFMLKDSAVIVRTATREYGIPKNFAILVWRKRDDSSSE